MLHIHGNPGKALRFWDVKFPLPGASIHMIVWKIAHSSQLQTWFFRQNRIISLFWKLPAPLIYIFPSVTAHLAVTLRRLEEHFEHWSEDWRKYTYSFSCFIASLLLLLVMFLYVAYLLMILLISYYYILLWEWSMLIEEKLGKSWKRIKKEFTSTQK